MDKRKLAIEKLKEADRLIDEAKNLLKESGEVMSDSVFPYSVHLFKNGSTRKLAEETGEECKTEYLEHISNNRTSMSIGKNIEIFNLEGWK